MNDYDVRSNGDPTSIGAPYALAPPKKSNNEPKVANLGTTTSKKVSSSKEVATPKDVNLSYNIVDNMNKMNVNISMFDISKLEPQQKLLMK